MLSITPRLTIPETELREEFIRAPGPGGQNVNKVATAVQLRFDLAHSPSLPGDVRARALHLAGGRVTTDGVLLIRASRHRTQERNRADARERLVELLRAALHPPRPRRPTHAGRGAHERRLASKQHRARTKSQRQRPRGEE